MVAVIIPTLRNRQPYLRSYALSGSLNQYLENIIAMGESESDICMIKDCGIGISFCSSKETLNLVAKKTISERKFTPVLEFIN